MFQKACEWTDQQISDRADEILDGLTLKEKTYLLHGNWQLFRDLIVYRRGYNPVPIQSYGNKRYGIAPVAFTDGPRGVVMGKSTCFPVPMARAASFDRDLERRIGEAIGKEARAGGANYFGGVCVNLLMHPAGGRAQESYGEDPYLVGEMGAALVKGVQTHNVMACTKHFALNNMENSRFRVNVNCSERTLREVYLPHFKKCVDAGTASLMGSYNRFRGDQASESAYLLTTILREDWGFQGFVITDFIYALRNGAKALRAGMDMEMPLPVQYGENLINAVEKGTITEADIDRALKRRLVTQLTFQHTKDPLPSYDKSLIASKEHIALAKEAGEKSIVLLKNEHQVLPLRKDIRKLLVLGRLADAKNTGDHGSSSVYPPYVVSVLQGLRDYLGSRTAVLDCPESDIEKAKKLAAEADAVVIVAGNDFNDEGEFVMPDESINTVACMADGFTNNGHKLMGKILKFISRKQVKTTGSYTSADKGSVGGDRKSLSLRQSEIDLINTIAPINPNTVVSLVCGSTILTEEWDRSVPSILYGWYSGMEGGNALARVLFGDVNPSGRLPFVIPHSAADLPEVDFQAEEITYDYYHGYTKLDHEAVAPAYPFGFGLSYTTYAYDTPTAVIDGKNQWISVEVQVKNTGSRRGEAVVQAYVSAPDSQVERPVKLLKAFERITLEAGESGVCQMKIPFDELAYYDEAAKRFVVEPTLYRIWVGSSEADRDLKSVDVTIT